jgi:hypothetical protein
MIAVVDARLVVEGSPLQEVSGPFTKHHSPTPCGQLGSQYRPIESAADDQVIIVGSNQHGYTVRTKVTASASASRPAVEDRISMETTPS